VSKLKQILSLLNQLRRENPKEFLNLQKEILPETLSNQELKQLFIGELTKDPEFIQESAKQIHFQMERRGILN